MRIILILAAFLLSSCSRIHYDPIGKFYFSVEEMNKEELIAKLDTFSLKHNLVEQSAGERNFRLEKPDVIVSAYYENESEIAILINNYLNSNCYLAASYDYSKKNFELAHQIAIQLNTELTKRFNGRISFHSEPHCKSAL
jgi:hypothetical protein